MAASSPPPPATPTGVPPQATGAISSQSPSSPPGTAPHTKASPQVPTAPSSPTPKASNVAPAQGALPAGNPEPDPEGGSPPPASWQEHLDQAEEVLKSKKPPNTTELDYGLGRLSLGLHSLASELRTSPALNGLQSRSARDRSARSSGGGMSARSATYAQRPGATMDMIMKASSLSSGSNPPKRGYPQLLTATMENKPSIKPRHKDEDAWPSSKDMPLSPRSTEMPSTVRTGPPSTQRTGPPSTGRTGSPSTVSSPGRSEASVATAKEMHPPKAAPSASSTSQAQPRFGTAHEVVLPAKEKCPEAELVVAYEKCPVLVEHVATLEEQLSDARQEAAAAKKELVYWQNRSKEKPALKPSALSALAKSMTPSQAQPHPEEKLDVQDQSTAQQAGSVYPSRPSADQCQRAWQADEALQKCLHMVTDLKSAMKSHR